MQQDFIPPITIAVPNKVNLAMVGAHGVDMGIAKHERLGRPGCQPFQREQKRCGARLGTGGSIATDYMAEIALQTEVVQQMHRLALYLVGTNRHAMPALPALLAR